MSVDPAPRPRNPQPSDQFRSARRILRDQAVSRTERRLRVSPEVMPAIRDAAQAQLAPALGAVDPLHAGWAALSAGTLLARNSERLAAAGADIGADSSFTAGLAWAALIVAVVGDGLLEQPARPFTTWVAGDSARDVRRLAAALVPSANDVAQDPHAAAGERFARYALQEITDGLPGLDRAQGGYTLATLAVWATGHAEPITGPLTRRRFGRREFEPERTRAGSAFAAAVLARLGEGLIGG